MEQNPKIEAAHALGAKGGEPSEAERLLFEAWMQGHRWKVYGNWDGKSYTHSTEKAGEVHGGAMQTRQLWAAWRDRAALGAQQPAEPWPVRGVRVDGDKVIIAVKGGNDAARWLCGEVLAKHTTQPGPDYAALEREHLGDPDKKTGIYQPMCFLQDTRTYVGNCPMWWQAGGGYTSRIDRAERFTIERALSQCKTRDTDRAWLCSDIEPLARPTIDHQEMRDIKPVPVAEHKKPDDTEGGAV